METWKKELERSMKRNGEDFDDVENFTVPIKDLDHPIKDQFVLPFRVWTKWRVYFPLWIDGCGVVHSVQRNPS